MKLYEGQQLTKEDVLEIEQTIRQLRMRIKTLESEAIERELESL
jgi:hypothetical protein